MLIYGRPITYGSRTSLYAPPKGFGPSSMRRYKCPFRWMKPPTSRSKADDSRATQKSSIKVCTCLHAPSRWFRCSSQSLYVPPRAGQPLHAPPCLEGVFCMSFSCSTCTSTSLAHQLHARQHFSCTSIQSSYQSGSYLF
jgi:hypothetical protein